MNSRRSRAYTNPTTDAHIFGSFLVVGDNEDFCSLTPLQLERALQVFGPQLSHQECDQIMLTHEQGVMWVELVVSLPPVVYHSEH